MNTKIIRQQYLDQLALSKDQNVIKVVTGVRRSGKSTLLGLFQDTLREQGITDSQIQSCTGQNELYLLG